MKSVALVPYCPLPADSGGKTEMWKHLEVLKAMGECTILSAAGKPVGAGWTPEAQQEIEAMGFGIELREKTAGRTLKQLGGIAYAAVCKGLGLEKAFGHTNPYHRHAFPESWWRARTEGADLAVIIYSYWAWLPCRCPKVVALFDLWSDYMWEGSARETEDLRTADLVVVISKNEEEKLKQRGIRNVLWSPPSVPPEETPDRSAVGLVGSGNPFNVEGLRWLEAAANRSHLPVRVYGALARQAHGDGFEKIGAYMDDYQPYRECGIVLMTTARGMGVQIKGIQALACGRAIVARRGAMRGLPAADGAWVEVDTPEDMIRAAEELRGDPAARRVAKEAAAAYYEKHLHHERVRDALRGAYEALLKR